VLMFVNVGGTKNTARCTELVTVRVDKPTTKKNTLGVQKAMEKMSCKSKLRMNFPGGFRRTGDTSYRLIPPVIPWRPV